jgi:4-hydroxythreonine-4-phosphate dehydrogenase
MASNTVRSRLAISIGCPSGVGPDVCLVAAVRAQSEGLRCALVGDPGAIFRAAAYRGIEPKRMLKVKQPGECFDNDERVAIICPTEPLAPDAIAYGIPSKAGGRAQLAWIDFATRMCIDAHADAIVTGPVSKDAIARSGAPGAASFAGHTEHIARLVGSHDPTMIFVTDQLSVALVTTHLRLADVPAAITVKGVELATRRAAETVWTLGKDPARVVVAALNPHAGEGRMFGEEEATVIAPGVARASLALSAAGIRAVIEGPISAETAFRKAFDGQHDAVVAMYHDQGTIPMKVRCFGKAVNVTAGLPIVRTSVDHGTAYDIAGTGKADPASMIEAVRLADRLVRSRRVMNIR